MKIVVLGSTGHLGTMLARVLQGEGHDVVVLNRSPSKVPWRVAVWDGEAYGSWAAEFEEADAVVNLTSHSVNCRYDAANRREIMDSRANSTRVVGEAISRARSPPRVWLQMSTATIYADRYDAPNDETSGVLGGTEPIKIICGASRSNKNKHSQSVSKR